MDDVEKAARTIIPENRDLSGSGIMLGAMAVAVSGMTVEEMEGWIGVILWAVALEETDEQ